MMSRIAIGRRRVSPRTYKFLLTTHIMVSVAWLGATLAKIVLELAAMTSGDPAALGTLRVTIRAVDLAFPPLAIATLISGAWLSLGTRWGLLRHWWVATKLALTVGVVVTAIALGSQLLPQVAAAPAQAMGDGTLLGTMTSPMTLLLALSITHLVMLGVATVVSVYKPWGKTPWSGRRAAGRPAGRPARGGKADDDRRRVPVGASTRSS